MPEILYVRMAEAFSALSSPTRLAIIDVLRRGGEMSVGALGERLGLARANVSQHLRLLRARDMVRTRQRGTRVLCRVGNPTVLRVLDLLRESMTERVGAEANLSRAALDIEPLRRGMPFPRELHPEVVE
jgi:ArsR family transcriptional regulator